MTLELMARIGIDLYGGALARNHSADILLLEVRLDPGALAVDEREHTESGYRHLADLKIVGILDHAVHRRAHVGARQVEPGLVDGRLRLRDLRLLARRKRGVRVCGASVRIREILLGRADF